MLPVELFAPNETCLYIEKAPIINFYEIIADAVYKVESNCDSLAYNKKEKAVGGFQIRQIRVNDYNKRTGSNYKPEDFYSLQLSRECFLYYAHINKDAELIAKRWNGSGKKTIIYWNKVKKYL
jgi:hypothetical protein